MYGMIQFLRTDVSISMRSAVIYMPSGTKALIPLLTESPAFLFPPLISILHSTHSKSFIISTLLIPSQGLWTILKPLRSQIYGQTPRTRTPARGNDDGNTSPKHGEREPTTDPGRHLLIDKSSNECKRRKIKCNGQSPCQRCGRQQLECVYAERTRPDLTDQQYVIPFIHLPCITDKEGI